MAEGNGVDQGALAEMLRGVILTQERMLVSPDRLQASQDRLQAEQKRMARDLIELRRDVATYHASVFGRGILISELEERVRRL